MIDKLRPEVGKYLGPKPTFFGTYAHSPPSYNCLLTCTIAGFKAEDVLMSQSFGLVDLDNQPADFGADQVILVRDEDVREEIHSRIGREILILTILQSKGMEFEDVVLLNFFSSSAHGPHYRALDKLIDSSRFGWFDSKKHSVGLFPIFLYVFLVAKWLFIQVLCAELKVGLANALIMLWASLTPRTDTLCCSNPLSSKSVHYRRKSTYCGADR